MGNKYSTAFNLLSLLLLALTALMCLFYAAVFFVPSLAGPFATGGPSAAQAMTPTSTPTVGSLFPPTWTPTVPVTQTTPMPTTPVPTSPPPTPMNTNSPLPTITPFTPTPKATVMIEAEWPRRMEFGRSDSVRVSLVRTTAGVFIPTIEVTGHTAVVASPIPVGTPEVSLQKAFGSEYEACASANLVGTAFDIKATTIECRSVEQDKLTWEWNLIPREAGNQVVNVNVDVQWKPKKDSGPTLQHQIWRSRLEILVQKPLITTDQLGALNVGALFLGLVLATPWLYDKAKGRRSGKGRLVGQRTALRQALCDYFSLEELRTLCADLNVDYDSLEGEGKEAKVRELIAYLQRRESLGELISYICQHRPDVKL